MVRDALTLGGLLLLAACQPPPPENNGGTTTTPTETTPTTSSSSTTFPTETTFGGPDDEVPAHWLHITETGDWNLTPAGGPYTGLTGTLMLEEIVDELDYDYGPDCLVTWTLDGTEPEIPGTCPGCDPSILVHFTVSGGDSSTCQSPDMAPTNPDEGWRMAWHPGDQAIYRDINATGVWVRWWDGVKTADAITFEFLDSYPIFVEEEEM